MSAYQPKHGSPTQIAEASLHDGSTIHIEIYGEGHSLLLPVNPRPVEGPKAEELRTYGADPALGKRLIDGLSDIVRVIAFDYEGQVMQNPKPYTLTPANLVKDFLSIADAANADMFAYYGYSWLAMAGLQLALRTNRLSGLIMGGYPPVDGPYEEMLMVTTAANAMAGGDPSAQALEEDEWSTAALSNDQTQQFVTLYSELQAFNDRDAQSQIHCPRLCFVGSADEITYGQNWGNVFISLADPVIKGRPELESAGWNVHVLEGLDHMQAMQAAHVLPIIHPWLDENISRRT